MGVDVCAEALGIEADLLAGAPCVPLNAMCRRNG
jgi:hypothetical protein